ncbi:hypothetical protein CCMA1212_009358 [Trichoderma ghanense]|uniref:C2H2-type domain-containing protein n=1 Tax=Trichoderma ghanense TaxID=65468 RepID=A0ABY2GSH7_9HYPO
MYKFLCSHKLRPPKSISLFDTCDSGLSPANQLLVNRCYSSPYLAMESLADAGLAAMQRFKLLQQFEIQEPASNESKIWPKSLFLAQFDRFELWAVNLGLFVMGHGSLDYRIRDSESMREAILKMVKNLTRSLDEVLDYLNGEVEQEEEESDIDSEIESDMESDMDLLLDSVKDPIDRLYKMAVWIRNPATRMPSSKARNFQQIDQETKVDLFKAFEAFDYDYISSIFLQYEKNKALQENPAAKYEEEVGDIDDQDQVWEPVRTTLKLNKLRIATGTESYLVRRIAQANGRRRQQFAYWRSHKDKFRAHSFVVVDAPTHKLPNAGHQMQGGDTTVSAKAPLTVTTATQLRPLSGDAKEVFEKANVLDHAVSEYAPSAWEPSKDIVSFPLPPQVASTEQFFECPYCFTICPVSILSEKAWRAHLIRDLRPYVCTFQRCSSSDQLYDSRDDWIQHEVSAHQTIYRCPRHQEQTFNTSEAYELHIHNHCQGETLSLSLAKSTTTNIQRSCPVCSIVLQTTHKLQSHIALHLERFAMFTLPRSADDTDGAELKDQSTGAHLDSDRSRDGCSDTGSVVSFAAENSDIVTKQSLGNLDVTTVQMLERMRSVRRNSLVEQDQHPRVPQGSNEEEKKLTTATPLRNLETMDTNHGSTASNTVSSEAAAADDDVMHEGGVSWKPNRDEYSQPNVSLVERDLATTTDDSGEREIQADRQLQEDPEMEDERDQVEREMEVYRHNFHPLWVAAQLESQLEAKDTRTQDMGGTLNARRLEMDLRTYRDEVGELENQFLTEGRKAERSRKAQVLTTKIRSFHWKTIEERLEEIRLERRARLEATRDLSTTLDEATGKGEEARQAQEAQEDQGKDTEMADPDDDLAGEPNRIRMVRGERKRKRTTVGSSRPNTWRCINDNCPMCLSWRCPNCEYCMS